MYLLYCVHLFLIPRGLSPACLCFGTIGVVTRCFLTSWGEVFWGGCWEAGGWCFHSPLSTFVWHLYFWLCFPPLTLTLFLCALPLPIFLQYQCQLWRLRLTSLKTEKLKDKEEEGDMIGYLSGWSSQKTALPTWTDCFSRSTAGTQTGRQQCAWTTHAYSKACRGFCHGVQIIDPLRISTLSIFMMPEHICFLFRQNSHCIVTSFCAFTAAKNVVVRSSIVVMLGLFSVLFIMHFITA